MTADTPDTNKALADIDRAVTRVRDYLHELGLDPGGVGPLFAGKMATAVENLLDHWSYLRYCLEQEGAPLPAMWVLAAPPPAPTSGPDPDGQLASLRRAALAYGKWLETHPQLADPSLPADPASNPAVVTRMLAEKGAHLAACVAAVDAMCTDGDLPGDWAGPYWTRHGAFLARAAGPLLADPRVTANGGAAALAGWDLPAPDKTIGSCHVELMGHRVRVGVVSEVTMFGEPFLRIDFPQDSESSLPEFYRPAAVYAITPDPPARPYPSRSPHVAAGHYIEAVEADPFGEGLSAEDPY